MFTTASDFIKKILSVIYNTKLFSMIWCHYLWLILHRSDTGMHICVHWLCEIIFLFALIMSFYLQVTMTAMPIQHHPFTTQYHGNQFLYLNRSKRKKWSQRQKDMFGILISICSAGWILFTFGIGVTYYRSIFEEKKKHQVFNLSTNGINFHTKKLQFRYNWFHCVINIVLIDE